MSEESPQRPPCRACGKLRPGGGGDFCRLRTRPAPPAAPPSEPAAARRKAIERDMFRARISPRANSRGGTPNHGKSG
jgi:hypothetical protein